MPRFEDFETFPHCSYHVDVSWEYLAKHLDDSVESYGLNIDPDFQRAHVWTEEQQIKYCEYVLRGGRSGKELYFNCPGWDRHAPLGEYVIVDGKQRLQAVRRFMNNEISVFGHRLSDFSNRPDMLTARFSWNVASLDTHEEVLQWYLDFNAGGSVHTASELDKVRNMLKEIRVARVLGNNA